MPQYQWAVEGLLLRMEHAVLEEGRGEVELQSLLAIAGTFNGIAHPALALAAGGYFPGLISSPVIGVAGVLLWRSLLRSTQQ